MDLREQVKQLEQQLRAVCAENAALHQNIAALDLEIERLRIETFTDPLTGAYNRTGLRHIWAEVAKEVTAVMIIDSDRFKQINDRYGHGTGDVVICHICDAIRSSGVIVARTMGDEFIGLITDPDPEKIAETIRVAVARPRSINGHKIVTTVTIGLCLVEDHNTSMEDHNTSMIEYLDLADAALYQGKNAGRNAIVTVTTR